MKNNNYLQIFYVFLLFVSYLKGQSNNITLQNQDSTQLSLQIEVFQQNGCFYSVIRNQLHISSWSSEGVIYNLIKEVDC